MEREKKNIKKEKGLPKEEKPKSIFTGLSFKGNPVAKEKYLAAYPEYVKRCTEV